MIQRDFFLGDKWLYYKIYTGVKIADNLLEEIIYPLTIQLKNEQLIDKWFFIRYNDPDFHIRLRFFLTDTTQLSKVLSAFNTAILPYVDNDLVWNIQNEPYRRETERYGASNYDKVEEIFHIDSHNTLELLSMIEGDEGDEIRWLYGLKFINNLLDIFFKNDDVSKFHFIKKYAGAFAQEYKMDKQLRKQINTKYKAYQSVINDFLSEVHKKEVYKPVYSLLQQRLKHYHSILAQIDIPESILASIIHMSVNRLFRSKNRQYELLLYQFLFLYNRNRIRNKLTR